MMDVRVTAQLFGMVAAARMCARNGSEGSELQGGHRVGRRGIWKNGRVAAWEAEPGAGADGRREEGDTCRRWPSWRDSSHEPKATGGDSAPLLGRSAGVTEFEAGLEAGVCRGERGRDVDAGDAQ